MPLIKTILVLKEYNYNSVGYLKVNSNDLFDQ